MTKLEERRKQYGIPPIPYLPAHKVVLVFRLPNEERTVGGLYIPAQGEEAKPAGVLVAAGLTALDEMKDHMIEVGDIVHFGRFAGWEREIQRDPEGKGKSILQIKVEDLLGSEDAIERANNYTIEFDEETGEHRYELKKPSKRKVA